MKGLRLECVLVKHGPQIQAGWAPSCFLANQLCDLG